MSTQNKYAKNKRPRVFQPATGPSLAKQSQAQECDINYIMAKYSKTGVLDHLNVHQGEYGDFQDASDFLESQILVQKAQDMFHTIPSDIRKVFHNDAGKFLDFVQNPENIDSMVTMGLAHALDVPRGSTEPPLASGSPKDQASDETPPPVPK